VIIDPANVTFDAEQQARILAYGETDVAELKEMLKAMGIALSEQSKQTMRQAFDNRLWRGKVGAMMAIVESTGTPINMETFGLLRENADAITTTAKANFNIETGANLFQWKTCGSNSKTWHFDTFSESQDAFDRFITEQGWLENWATNKNGKYSKSEDALKNKSLHPTVDGLLKVRKVSKAMSSIKGSSNGKTVPTYKRIGDDNRLRVPLFPYGTQTGRNAAPASSYIYAQGGWMKCVIDIPKGYRVVETDFSSQEFIIGGVLGKDANMIEAYKTDVYISFGFIAGQFDPKYKSALEVIAAHKSGDKDIKAIRQKMKGVVLSLSYGARAPSISASTGLPLHEVELLVVQYEQYYADYYTWRDSLWQQHCQGITPLTLEHTGWYLGFDNNSSLSTMNFPVQSTGSTILHKSLERVLCDKELKANGVEVINTLHDAIYYLVPETYLDAEARIEEHMSAASREILGCDDMKLETDVWHYGENLANGYSLWEQFKPILGI
jgi:DNA polymerase I-like protein with 3'-5' exonuclease and polymerase domains